RRAQKRARRRNAPAVAGGDLVDANPFLRDAVEIGVEWQARLARGFQIAERQWVDAIAEATDMNRTAASAPGLVAFLGILDPFEDRQQIIETPADVSAGRPRVIVLALAADPHHCVDGTGASQKLSARPVVGVAGKTRIGLGPKIPVHHGIEEG